jgi:hypothetical protein
MKIARGLLGAVLLMASTDLSVAQQKRDLFGFSTNMTFAEVSALAMSKGITCRSPPSASDNSSLLCQLPSGSLEILFTKMPRESRAKLIKTNFKNAETDEQLEQSIRDQFSLPKLEKWVRAGKDKMFTWDFGNGVLFNLTTGDLASLTLIDQNLFRADKEAYADKKRNPTPKF